MQLFKNMPNTVKKLPTKVEEEEEEILLFSSPVHVTVYTML